MGRGLGWLNVDDVQKFSGWSKGWIRTVAKRDGWLVQKTRPRLYALDDVLASVKGHRDHAVERHLLGKQTGGAGRHAGTGGVLTRDG